MICDSIYIKKAPLSKSPAQRVSQSKVVTVPAEPKSYRQQSSRKAALNDSWWKCVTLSVIVPHTGCADCLQDLASQSRRTS